ncbi:hypothetical protein HNQ56_003823 [Anaerotaenia torta]|uniref:hypothetical protein n=1 Tax=Anaerotaenia torta TaxID=433293 RepID=UPI003D193AF2
MKYLRNRKVAIGITAFAVFLSILFGSHSSLMQLREETSLIFYSGEKKNGKGIQHDLEYITDQCYNLTVVAGRYMDPDDERIKEVLRKRDLVNSAVTPREKYQTSESLIEAAMKLYKDLGFMSLEERDQYYRDSFAVNVESRQLIISHSSYNELAVTFNESLERFPANVLSKITFVKPLELYE